jgi:hypothetical protein
LLETATLTLTNYPSLMTTNAAKYRLTVGPDKGLIEFGLRRAQGPDGGVSASRHSYMGGFDGTSDVLAGYLFGIPIRGTHAHSYVQSFIGIEDLKDHTLVGADGKATLPVLAPRLKVADIKGKSLMIHAGGDNYSDAPAPLGGGGARVACGVVK